MTFSDDHTSAPAPFSGDGSIFDHPDVLLQSPTTSERVVDTQSGFLVVIKRLGDRLSLSCKRRVGTPPSSSVLLTPDESIKLSRILSSSVAGVESSAVETSGRINVGNRRRFSLGSAGARNRGPLAVFSRPALILAIVGAVSILLGAAFFAGKATAPAKLIKVDALAPATVEQFARSFVSEMLDFNPDTYKYSQVQAMAAMSPELLANYWTETRFPLERRQLQRLTNATVIIDKVVQERQTANSSVVDIFAQTVSQGAAAASPLHIKLKLVLNADGHIQVVQQEDLTNAPAAAPGVAAP